MSNTSARGALAAARAREIAETRARPSPAFPAPAALTEEEAAALLRELDEIIESERYFLSPRIRTLSAILAKLKPEPAREPLPPPRKVYAPPSKGR
jgi:hypothetical protein